MPGTAPPTAPSRPSVVTVRMSPELHEQLKAAAHRERISLNQFCIRACNSHDALLEACEASLEVLEKLGPPEKWDDGEIEPWLDRVLRDAISQAKAVPHA